MSHLLDENILETLTFERSKTWSNFLKICEVNGDGIDIQLNELEEVFEDQNEDVLDALEEAEEEDVKDDIEKTTMKMSKAELTLMLSSKDSKQILNQTLPIVEEHVRKWKEAGLDRILNTFDAQKIEQHVGDWLRRHNSAYGDNNVVGASSSKSCCKYHKTKLKADLYFPVDTDDSETESMYSVEPARYIRESHECSVSTPSKCSSLMETMKMYRTTTKKRLMYDCGELSEVHGHRNVQMLFHRRDQLYRRKRDHGRQLRYHSMHNPYNHELNLNGPHRKYLRKCHDDSIMYSSSSSSEDDRRHGRCDCSPCLRGTVSQTDRPYYTYCKYQSHSQSYRDYHHRRLESGSSSFRSTVRDIRPRLFENECKCCNSDRLCSDVIHIANSSTEEWLVQNESSPDQMIEMVNTKPSPAIYFNRRAHCSKEIVSSEEEKETIAKIKPILSIKENVLEAKKNTIAPTDKLANAENASLKEQVGRWKKTPKADPLKPMRRNGSLSRADIPSSLSLVIDETVKTPCDVEDVGTEEKTVAISISKGKTMCKKQNEEHDKIIDKTTISKNGQKKKTVIQSDVDNIRLKKNALKKTLKLPKKSTVGNHSVASNSSAVLNQTSCALVTQMIASVNSIVEISSSDSSISEQPIGKNKMHSERDVDCTMVTSTTDCDASAEQSEATLVAKRPDIKITKKGILLYAPKQVAAGNPAQSKNYSEANYTLTEQSLRPIIGDRRAKKFLEYHIGSRSFDSRYSVYYRPTPKMVALISDSKSLDLDSPSSSGSDDDIFEQVNRYGVVYPVLENRN